MKHRDVPIVGREAIDQRVLRPVQPVRELDEFLEFLAHLEAVFGVLERPREITTGDRFLL